MKTLIILITALFFSANAMAQELEMPDYDNQKKRSIEVEFFSPLTGNFTVGYEQLLKENLFLEGRLGIIGAGIDINQQKGSFLKAGLKFKVNPDYMVEGMRSTHYMQGGYFKVEGTYSVFSRELFEWNSLEIANQTDHMFALHLIYGRQWALADILVVDPYLGLGFGAGSYKGVSYPYSHVYLGRGFPLTATAGLSIGILLK